MQVTYSRRSESGQAFLMVVLVMVVAVTVGITLASRTLVNQRSSIEEDQSQKAFSAAEAALEQAINSKGNIGLGDFTTDSQYQATVTSLDASEFVFNGGNSLQPNEGYDLWLSDYSSDPSLIYKNQWSGYINVFWGSSSSACQNAALELIVYSGAYTGPTTIPTVTRYAYDPCAARRTANKFNPTGTTTQNIGGKTFYYNITIPSISNGLFMRIVPIYATTPLAVQGSNGVAAINLHAQGEKIDALGKTGDTQRKISVYQGYPALPSEIFQYGIFVPASQ